VARVIVGLGGVVVGIDVEVGAVIAGGQGVGVVVGEQGVVVSVVMGGRASS